MFVDVPAKGQQGTGAMPQQEVTPLQCHVWGVYDPQGVTAKVKGQGGDKTADLLIPGAHTGGLTKTLLEWVKHTHHAIYVEPQSKINRLCALDLGVKVSNLHHKSTGQIAHFHTKSSAPERLLLLDGSTYLFKIIFIQPVTH